jgi:hypothetical protein
MWNEMVEFGKALSGTVQGYDPRGDIGFTGQITLPALLIRAGVSNYALAILTSSLTCGLAFAAVGSVSLLVTSIPLSALVVPVLLCKYPFYNFHGYPVKFPIYFYIFGQVGLYAAVLTICLIALKKYRSAAFMAGMMPFIHAPWVIAVWTFGAFYFFLLRPSVSTRHVLLFSGGLALSAATFLAHQYILVPDALEHQRTRLAEVAPISTEIITATAGKILPDDTVSVAPVPHLSQGETGMPRSNKGDVPRPHAGHNPLLRNSENPYRTVLIYVSTDIAALVLLYLLAVRRRIPDLNHDALRGLLYPLLALVVSIAIFKIADEIEPTWSVLSTIHPAIPNAFLRIMPNRFLNLNSVLLPVLLLALSAHLALSRGSLTGAAALLILAMAPALAMTDGRSLDFASLIGVLWPNIAISQLSLLIAALPVVWPRAGEFRLPHPSPVIAVWVGWAMVGFLVLSLGHRTYFQNKPYGYLREADTPVLAALAGSKSPVIATLNVQGFDNFNLMAESNRPYYLTSDGTLDHPTDSSLKIALDCRQMAEAGSHAQRVLIQKKCFAQRSPELWVYIGATLQSKHVLANREFELNLPLVAETDSWRLYEIPTITTTPASQP